MCIQYMRSHAHLSYLLLLLLDSLCGDSTAAANRRCGRGLKVCDALLLCAYGLVELLGLRGVVCIYMGRQALMVLFLFFFLFFVSVALTLTSLAVEAAGLSVCERWAYAASTSARRSAIACRVHAHVSHHCTAHTGS